MTPQELELRLKSTTDWDERVRLIGQLWRVQSKKFHDQPDKLYYAWEEIMTMWEET